MYMCVYVYIYIYIYIHTFICIPSATVGLMELDGYVCMCLCMYPTCQRYDDGYIRMYIDI